MAFLQVETSDGKVKKYELSDKRPVVIGRSDGVDLMVPDVNVSRRHALVQRDADGNWQLQDLGSRNKTYVEKQPVTTHSLRNGDIFTIGDVQFRFVEKPATKTAVPPQKAGTSPKTAPSPKSVSCPVCKASLAPSAVLCVNCGLNLKTGKQLSSVTSNMVTGKNWTDTSVESLTCPCCNQTLPPGVKICVKCGVDARSGRSILIVQDNNLDKVYIYAESIIRILSWIIFVGIYPIASEAFGLRKPWVIRGIAVITVLISVWFFFACIDNSHPTPAVLNLMLWCGDADSYQRKIDAARKEWKERGATDNEINEVLEAEGALNTGRYHHYQLITNAFLHAGILHLAGNMLFLMILGSRVNALIGNVLTLILYPILAVCASAAFMISMTGQTLTPALGASGAIMGLAGMYLVLMPTPQMHMAAWLRWILIRWFHLSLRLFSVRGFWVVLFYIAFDVFYTLFGLKDEVAHWAHLGGFFAGMAFGLILLVSRLINARGGDLLSVILGKRAWALIGKPDRKTPALW